MFAHDVTSKHLEYTKCPVKHHVPLQKYLFMYVCIRYPSKLTSLEFMMSSIMKSERV